MVEREKDEDIQKNLEESNLGESSEQEASTGGKQGVKPEPSRKGAGQGQKDVGQQGQMAKPPGVGQQGVGQQGVGQKGQMSKQQGVGQQGIGQPGIGQQGQIGKQQGVGQQGQIGKEQGVGQQGIGQQGKIGKQDLGQKKGQQGGLEKGQDVKPLVTPEEQIEESEKEEGREAA